MLKEPTFRSGVSSSPLADERESEKFLQMLFGCDSTVFQTFDDKGQNKKLAHQHHDTDSLLDYNRKGAGVFFTVNHVTEGCARANATVDRVRYNFVDLDEDGDKKLDFLLGKVPLPDYIVESSPGKYHCYWKAIDQSLQEFKRIQQELAATFGSDKAVCDLARVMRLPGYIHHKGEPFRSRFLGSGALVKSRRLK